jgi:hypothetical protein
MLKAKNKTSNSRKSSLAIDTNIQSKLGSK